MTLSIWYYKYKTCVQLKLGNFFSGELDFSFVDISLHI